MIRCRSFLNSDLSGIVSVWNSQPPLRARLSGMTPDIFEQYVLAKPYFDPRGLIVAADDRNIVGFVHAGFSIGERPGDLDRAAGLICMLMVNVTDGGTTVAQELLREGEAYLVQQGAKEIRGGAIGNRAPFYLGVYGGSQLPGIMACDRLTIDALGQAGYVEHQKCVVLQRELAGFRPPVERQCMTLRRQFRVAAQSTPPSGYWYEACTYCWIERTTFTLEPAAGGVGVAALTFWDMEPLASCQGVRAMGLLGREWGITPANVDSLVFLLGESMRQLSTQGIAVVEAQADNDDGMLLDACRRLGFREVDRGIQFLKPSQIVT